jgi:uncharacterized protein (TIGR02145 family)
MKVQKMIGARVTLLSSCLALLCLAPLACDAPLEESDDDDDVIECDATPTDCWDQGCVGSWGDDCMVQGDICVPLPEHANMNPAKCFRAECYCETGCAWDGAQCAPDTGCPAVPLPTVPTDPSPYEGCDSCQSSGWQPEDGLKLKWSEPAELYLQYEIEVHRNPLHNQRCFVDPEWLSERIAGTTYDIYFGTEPDPPLLQAAVPTTRQELPGLVKVDGGTHDLEYSAESGGAPMQGAEYQVPGPLALATPYFWRVVVHNKDGETASSPIWQFTSSGPTEPTICPGTPTVVDAEGNSYETAQIGNQCWTKTPLKIGDFCDGAYTCQQDNGNVEKSCQISGPNCTGYYTWNELMRYGAGSLCPAGWHVPTKGDWQVLFNQPDKGRLNPAYGGYIQYSNVSGGEGATAYIWTASQQTSGLEGTAHVAVLTYPAKGIAPALESFNKGFRMTAFCLKN